MLPTNKRPPTMFTARTPNDPISDHRKYNMCMPKSQGLSKIWVAGLVLCFILCITVICIAIWVVSLLRNDSTNHLDYESSMKHHNAEEYIGIENLLEYNLNSGSPLLDSKHSQDENKFVGSDLEEHKTVQDIQILSSNSLNSKASHVDIMADGANVEENVHGVHEKMADNKIDQMQAMEKQSPKTSIFKNDAIKIVDNLSISSQTKNTIRFNSTNKYSVNVQNLTNLSNNNSSKKPEKNNFKTQISSPDAIVAQVTTDLLRVNDYLLNPEYDSSIKHPDSKITKKDHAMNKNKEQDQKNPQNLINHLTGYFNILGTEFSNNNNAYSDDYLYSEADAQVFYFDYEKVTWAGYLLEKIQELYNWVTNDLELNEGHYSKGNENAPLPQILKALNHTIIKGDASILFLKLRNLYFSENGTEFDPEKSRKMLTNTSSVISFGFLALDVILLRNIQIIAWEDQSTAEREMVKDMDIFALNSIFMDPQKVIKLYREIQFRNKLSSHDRENWEQMLNIKYSNNQEKTINGDNANDFVQSNINMAEEFIQFITSTFRAIVHLGQAFRNARNHSENKAFFKNRGQKIETKTEIDCMWTLYCRNLDKSTKLGGASGVLAKLNSIGLRLILGELRIERLLETVIEETLTDSKPLNCSKMFPKCSTEDAPIIILEEIVKGRK